MGLFLVRSLLFLVSSIVIRLAVRRAVAVIFFAFIIIAITGTLSFIAISLAATVVAAAAIITARITLVLAVFYIFAFHFAAAGIRSILSTSLVAFTVLKVIHILSVTEIIPVGVIAVLAIPLVLVILVHKFIIYQV